MNWSDLVKEIEVIAQGGEGNPEIADIVFDSRLVTHGALFAAIPGFKMHGDGFIPEAIKKGAVAVISENRQPACPVPWIQVADPRKTMAVLGKTLWHCDFTKMILIGVTGTNGKTTTAGLYHNLFATLKGSLGAWMFGTIAYTLGEKTIDALHTTPEAIDILRYIGTASQPPMAVSMEVSSHALMLSRVEGFVFDIAVWTNLTQDHLDFHKTMEAYYEAKKKLFTHHVKPDGVMVINIDDPWGRRLVEETGAQVKVTYGKSEKAKVRIIDFQCTWDGTEVTIVYNRETMTFRSCLVGAFNGYNITALLAGALGKGISGQDIQKSLDCMKAVPGRMERVVVPLDFTVIVDYAHTPDALVNVLSTARTLTKKRLICVFGCGGDRDKTKRPLMAGAVARYSDEAIITSDNPRTEKPESILRAIEQGVPLDFSHSVIVDRKEAIGRALTMGREGDCIVIAGKGHETYQEIHGVRHHFDDREVVRELAAFMNKR